MSFVQTVEDKREKLAIEFTAGERLLLERVRVNWIPFRRSVDDGGQYSHGFG